MVGQLGRDHHTHPVLMSADDFHMNQSINQFESIQFNSSYTHSLGYTFLCYGWDPRSQALV